jgi:hypothetical protein
MLIACRSHASSALLPPTYIAHVVTEQPIRHRSRRQRGPVCTVHEQAHLFGVDTSRQMARTMSLTRNTHCEGTTSRASSASEASSSAALKRANDESSCRMLTQPCGGFLFVGVGAIIERGARHHRVVAARHLLVLREAPDALSVYESQHPARVFAAASGGVHQQRIGTRLARDWHFGTPFPSK